MFQFLYDLPLFVTFILVATRIASILYTAPVYGSSVIKGHIRFLLSLIIAMIILPSVKTVNVSNPNTVLLIGLIAKEALFGACIGILAHLIFIAIQIGGQLVGIQMGFSVVNVMDPQTNANVSIISSFLNIGIMLLFIAIGGHLILIQAITASFQTLPVGVYEINPYGFIYLVKLFTSVFGTAIKITAPAFIALLILHFVMGIIGRMAPQINLMIVGFAVQIAVGMTVLAASLNYFYIAFEKLTHSYFEQIANLIRYL